jgi:hypothetical protein
MLTTADFLQFAQWTGILTLVCGALTLLGFILKWGFRFRLVGATGFMVVLTVGLFTLSVVPFMRTVVPGAVRYSSLYDNGGTQVVVGVPKQITASQLEATLRQAAGDFFSYGRLASGGENQLTIRARTIIHPEPGVSQPLYLGQVKRSLTTRNDDKLVLEISQENLAQLPKPNA